MKVKVFQPNNHGKIEFTRAELEKLLNEIYEEGRKDCERAHNYPFIYNTPYYGGSITGTTTTISSAKATDSIDKLTCNSVTQDGANGASLSTPTYTISIGDVKINQDEIATRAREILDDLTNAQNADCFTKLAKELNF